MRAAAAPAYGGGRHGPLGAPQLQVWPRGWRGGGGRGRGLSSGASKGLGLETKTLSCRVLQCCRHCQPCAQLGGRDGWRSCSVCDLCRVPCVAPLQPPAHGAAALHADGTLAGGARSGLFGSVRQACAALVCEQAGTVLALPLCQHAGPLQLPAWRHSPHACCTAAAFQPGMSRRRGSLTCPLPLTPRAPCPSRLCARPSAADAPGGGGMLPGGAARGSVPAKPAGACAVCQQPEVGVAGCGFVGVWVGWGGVGAGVGPRGAGALQARRTPSPERCSLHACACRAAFGQAVDQLALDQPAARAGAPARRHVPPALAHPQWGPSSLRRLDLSSNYSHRLRCGRCAGGRARICSHPPWASPCPAARTSSLPLGRPVLCA